MLKMILKMNFNFNIKDKLPTAETSIRVVTNGRDRHHTAKSGIKRSLPSVRLVTAILRLLRNAFTQAILYAED
jgi:hypothetical protein